MLPIGTCCLRKGDIVISACLGVCLERTRETKSKPYELSVRACLLGISIFDLYDLGVERDVRHLLKYFESRG